MRFQLGTGAVYPTPPPSFMSIATFMQSGAPPSNGADTSLQWDTFDGPSGESGIIIQGAVEAQGVTLSQMIVSWGGLEIAGRLEVSASPDKPLFKVFQTAPAGIQTINLNDLPLIIESYGLRCDNNSQGGEYVVTAYYRYTT